MRHGMAVANGGRGAGFVNSLGEGPMKEIANSFMQLLAVIMILVTLAVSTAALMLG